MTLTLSCFIYFLTPPLSRLAAVLGYQGTELSLVHSNVGFFLPGVLAKLTDALAQQVFLPALNELAGHGIPIPSLDGLTLRNPKVDSQDGYILVERSAEPNTSIPLKSIQYNL